MNNAAIPVVAPEKENGGTPPTPTPAAPAENTSESVTLTKEESDQLRRDAARARINQSKADRYDKLIGSGKANSRFRPSPVTPPSREEEEDMAIQEDRKAEKGLMGLALDPSFREVLDNDPTLRSLLITNPLSILPIFAPDALDAEDAIMLVREKLSARAEEVKVKATPPVVPPVSPVFAPPVGGVNPSEARTPNAEYEAARNNPNIEHAIAGMVKQGLKNLKGK